MSMSTHIYGIVPADAQYEKMASIWWSCIESKVSIPKEVIEFFNGDSPDDKGTPIDLEKHTCCTEYTKDSCEGVEIDIRKLPGHVKLIRFYNSF